MNWKTDSKVFEEVLKELAKESWLGTNRRWWPNYLFHFTDINNAVNILNADNLFARGYLDKNGGMQTDNASPIVIGQTDNQWKEYVRFYFRPRTPTQYNNEGFRPINSRTFGGAHCPVPVFFLFKSLPLLCQKDSKFSYGSLAVQDPLVYSTGREFENMPFEYIYHEGRYDPSRESYIKYHRHAELIIPGKCSLEHLEYIVCRSAAERDTLLFLLPPKVRRKWVNKIILETRLNLFFSYWTFVDKINLTKESVTFKFNPGEYVSGSFKAYSEAIEVTTGKKYTWLSGDFKPKESFVLGLKVLQHPENYIIKFYLDDQLAYADEYVDDDILPF